MNFGPMDDEQDQQATKTIAEVLNIAEKKEEAKDRMRPFLESRLATETCYSCGVVFGMPEIFKENRLKDHRLFYCPNGHGQYYLGKQA
jgi:hypothetical protein